MLTQQATEVAEEKQGPQVFYSQRFRIRPLTERDEALYCRLYTDPRVMRHIGAPLSQERAERAFQTTLRLMADTLPRLLSWVITDRQNGEALGIQGLSWAKAEDAPANGGDTRADAGRAELGIMLLRDANGKLVPEEATIALMQHGFIALALTRIDVNYTKANLATERVVRKLGFQFEPTPLTASDDDRRCFMAAQDWPTDEKLHKDYS